MPHTADAFETEPLPNLDDAYTATPEETGTGTDSTELIPPEPILE